MSQLPFELMLALRYLRPKRTFVSVITLISIIGVAVGVAVLIIVISVMSGFDHDLRDKILSFKADLTVVAAGQTMENYPAVMKVIASNQNVVGVSPFVFGPVLLETEPTNGSQAAFAAPNLRGVDPAHEADVSVLPQSIIAGKFDLSQRGLVVGVDFAQNNNLFVGDHVSIYSPVELKRMKEEQGKTNQEAILPDEYTVTGIFDVGYYEFDSTVVVASLENAQDLYALGDSVHGLMVVLRDPYQAPEVQNQLQATLGTNYNMITWMQENRVFLGALQVEKNVMFILLLCIVAVAALCILSAQITFVFRKTREIGMLKALGSTNLQVSCVFLIQGAIVGALGVISGLGLGILAVTYRNEFLEFMRRTTGWQLFPESIYGFSELPAIISPHDVTMICGISFLLICIIGGLLPAVLAGILKPVEALRYE